MNLILQLISIVKQIVKNEYTILINHLCKLYFRDKTVTEPLRYTLKNFANALFFSPKGFGTCFLNRQGDFTSYRSPRLALPRATTHPLTSDELHWLRNELADLLKRARVVARSFLTLDGGGLAPHCGVVRWGALKSRCASLTRPFPLVAPPLSAPLGLRRFFAVAQNPFGAGRGN